MIETIGGVLSGIGFLALTLSWIAFGLSGRGISAWERAAAFGAAGAPLAIGLLLLLST